MGAIIRMREWMNLDAKEMVGLEWPPTSETPRLNRYKTYEGIWNGNHEDVLDERNLVENQQLYIAVNLPKNLVLSPTDLMAGEPFTIEGESTDDLQEIWDRNQMQNLVYEIGVDTAWQGDGILIVNRNEAGEAEITTAQAQHWFPVIDQDNVRNVKYHKLCWPLESGDDKFLRVTEFHKGTNFNRLFFLKDGEIKREATDAEWAKFYPEDEDGNSTMPEPEIETGVDDFLLVHIPNYRTARELCGRSDYQGMEALFSALDARLTQVDVVLGKHSDPMWSLPAPMFQWLEANHGGQKWGEKLKELGVIMQSDEGKPERITWDGALEANFKMIEALVSSILTVGELDRELVEGISGDASGRALRIKLTRTLKKVERKWNYFKPAVEKALTLALEIEGKPETEFQVQRSDGLPTDALEDIQASREAQDAGLTSNLREIMKYHDVDDDEARKIQREIQLEADDARNNEGVNNAVTANRTPINVSVRPEDLE
jgi:hypothetical protein